MEILVGDDCSDDGTGEVIGALVSEYPDLIRYYRHLHRMGASRNLQALLKIARGDLVARLDGDDYWLPGKLEAQIGYLRDHPDCSAVYTNAMTLDENDTPIGLFNNAGDARFELPDLLRSGNFLNNSSVLFRRQSIAPWLEIKEPLIDYRIHLLHARYGFLGHIGKAMTAYRVNMPGSMVAEKNDYVRSLYWEALCSVPPELVSNMDRALSVADFARRVFFHSLSTGRWSLLKDWLPRVYGQSPFGVTVTSSLVFTAILRSGLSELWDRIARSARPGRIKILHRIQA